MAETIAATRQGEITDARASAARIILVIGALLGGLADLALRNAPGGLGWSIWVVGLALAALVVARRRGLGVTREQAAWLGVAIACAAAFAWRDAEELRVMNVFGTLVAIAMFAMVSTGLPVASILVARLRDVVAAGVYAVRDIVAGTPMLLVSDAELHRVPAVRGTAKWTVVRALLLTAPLVLVFTVLLSRADPVFASMFELPRIDVERIFEHVFLIGAFAWWSAGWLRGALLGVAQRWALPDRLPLRLGLGEITTSLGAVIVLFAIFVALQLRWMFGGADVVLATTGLTVAEYARRGFFELVAVAALVLPLILSTRALVVEAPVVRRHRVLSLVLLALLAAIVASALLRMRLYVGHFGLTTDRLYATAVMIWLVVVFVALAHSMARGGTRPIAPKLVLQGFVTLFALVAINPDRLVARVNLERGAAEREVDYVYLARLSGDAVPTVVTALRTAAPSWSACSAADSLETRWKRRENTAWNLGARRGRAYALEGLSPTDVQRLCSGAPAPVTDPRSVGGRTTMPAR